MDFDRRLKDLMNKAPVGVVAYRKRALVYANEACLRLLAVPSVEDLSRRNPMDFFAPHERERILGYIAARESGQPAPSGYEVDALRTTGECFPMTVRISQVDLNDGPAVLMFLEDATERVSARTALQKSERDYRGLFEAAHDAILIFEPADERILDANERACQMYGLPREDLVGRSLLEFSTDSATGRRRIEDMRADGVLAGFQTVHRRHDGNLISLDVNASIIEYKGREAILSIHRDITERLRAESSLRRSEENYRLLLENQTELVVKVDREGRFLFVSPSYCGLFGKAESELLGKALLPPVHEEDQSATLKAMKALDFWPNTAYVEQRALTTKGWRWIAWNYRAVLSSEGRLDAVVGVGRDVTERRASEDALRESEQIFRALAESSSVTIAIYQGQNLVYTNPSAEKLSGYTASELAGMPLTRLMNPDYRDLLVKRAQARQRGEPVLSQYEAPLLRKDGGTRWLLVSAARITYKGEPAGLITAFDVTERRSIEEALRQSAHEIQSIFKALPDLYFRMDSDGKILEWRSGRDEDLFLRPEQFLGRRMQDVIPPDAAAKISRAFREVQGGASTAAAEYTLPMPGGDKAFEARLAPLFQDQVVAVVRNVTERRRAQERLSASEERYRAMIESSPLGIYTYVLDQNDRLIFTAANPAADRIIGIDHKPLQGTTIEEAFPSLAGTEIPAHFRAVCEGGPTWHTERVDYEDERIRGAYEVYAFNTGPRSASVMFSDITDRSRLAAEVSSWKQRFELVTAASREVVYDYHVPSGSILWSGSVEQVLGYSPGEMGDIDKWSVRIHAEDRDEALRLLDEARRESKLYEVDYRFRHRCGHYVYILHRGFFSRDGAGETVRMIGMMADVTQDRRTLQALQESEEHFRRTFDLSPVGSVMVDLDRRFIRCNEAYCRFLGYNDQELSGKTFLDVTHPEDREIGMAEIARLTSGESEMAHFQKRYIRKDGGVIWGELTVRTVPDSEGHPLHFLTIVQDITERRLAEEALRKSETNFRSLYQQLQDGFVKVAMDGTILECNDAYCALTGYTREELARFTYTDLTPENWHAMERRHLEDEILKLGASELYEKEYRRKDGSLVPVELRAQVTRDGDGTPLFMWAVVRNITERKEAEAALVESEQRLRKIIEQSPLSIAIVALDGTIEYINRKAVEIFGYEHEDIPTMDRWWVLAYPDEAYRRQVVDTYMGLVGKALAEGGDIEGREYRVTCKDGSVKTMFIFGVPVADKVFVMFQDVTERKCAEEALRARLEQHRALVENARAVILQFDPDLTITYWNDYAAEFFGFAREEALGANLLDTVVPRTDTSGRNLEAMIRDIALDPNRYAANINENLTKDGRRVWVAWSNRPMVDSQGHLTGVLSIGTDITEPKRAEAELRLTNRQLLAVAASTQAMGQFTDVRIAMQSICEAAIGAFGASMAWVGMVVPESTEVTPLASAGRDEGYTDRVRVRWDLSPRAMGPAGRAIKMRKPQIMRVDDPDFTPWRDEAAKRGFQVVCALPLTQGEAVRGVIALYSEDPAAFDPGTFEILEIFAGQCAMVLVNAALYDEARRTIEELWKANEELKKG